MSDILTKAVVLVPNRNWQAIKVRTPQEAFCMMATNVATGLEIEGEEHIRPVTWEEWIRLPIRDQDEAVRTQGSAGDGVDPKRARNRRLETLPGLKSQTGGVVWASPVLISSRFAWFKLTSKM